MSFYYPVAVGGPITKIIDGWPQISNGKIPGIKVKPIYSGTYQESITKALTAVKGGDAPTTAVLLSTDMYTLIDEDAIVPFDDFIRTPEEKAWVKAFYPAFMENSQTGGKTWGIPFQRSTIVLTGTRKCSRRQGSIRARPPATWAGNDRVCAEAYEARRLGQGHAMGRADSVVGISLLAVPGIDHRK